MYTVHINPGNQYTVKNAGEDLMRNICTVLYSLCHSIFKSSSTCFTIRFTGDNSLNKEPTASGVLKPGDDNYGAMERDLTVKCKSRSLQL